MTATSPTADELCVEYQRLAALRAAAAAAPGRARVLGWDLEYPDPEVLAVFLDQIVFRRLNDFHAETDAPVILDCGANIGYTVLHYKRLFPRARITAFEPDPQFVPLLRRNLARNDAADVDVVEAAAWTTDGVAPWVMEHKDGSRLAGAVPDTAGATAVTQVATVDLARYLDRDIDLLKIDIEGAEFALVPHLAPRLACVRNILIECHLSDDRQYDQLAGLITLLRSSGFSIGLNSFGPWRDLIRQVTPSPLHAFQYLVLAGWRRPIESDDADAAAPYLGLAHTHERHHREREMTRLSGVDRENEQLRDVLAGLAMHPDEWGMLTLRGPFKSNGGHGWTVRVAPDVAEADTTSPDETRAVLLEDGRVLGPAHAIHEEIRTLGAGRYSHWGPWLYFSASDQSDPNRNGRQYKLVYRR